MLIIGQGIVLSEKEIDIHPIRAQGAGGQNVNKVSSAIHLRFPIQKSSLPEEIKLRLLELSDQRISKDGVVVIKSQEHRTQAANKQEAINRLRQLITLVLKTPQNRIPTKPRKSIKQKRLDMKTRHGQRKTQRRKVTDFQI